MRANHQELRFFEELRQHGIPIDGEVLLEMKDACRGLSLSQSPIAIDTAVFDLPCGGTGYRIGINMYNESNRIISPWELRLEIPWHEWQFRWLEKPWTKTPRESVYLFPSHGLAGHDPEDVLNHRLGSKGRILPGRDLDGLLLGVGQAPIPEQYKDRQAVWMQLSVIDQRGNPYELKVKFMVFREKQRQGQSGERLRGASNLFSQGKQRGVAARRF
jgi:hypothetical protein